MGPVEVHPLLPPRPGSRRRRARSSSAPTRTVPSIGASGAIAGVLGGYILLFPKARVVTVIFIVFFFTILELPALLILGFWFIQQALFGYFDLDSGGARGAASRTSPTSAASCSAWSRSSCSRTSASGGGSRRPPWPLAMRTARHRRRAGVHRPAGVPDAVRDLRDRARRAVRRSRCSCSRCSSSGSSGRSGAGPETADVPYHVFQGGRRRRRRRWPALLALLVVLAGAAAAARSVAGVAAASRRAPQPRRAAPRARRSPTARPRRWRAAARRRRRCRSGSTTRATPCACASSASRARGCCSTSTPAACCGGATPRACCRSRR